MVDSCPPQSRWIQKLSVCSQQVVPTIKDYAMTTVKEVLSMLQTVAGLAPVPFLPEAIGLMLKIIEVCEVR